MGKLKTATAEDYPRIKQMYLNEGFGSSTIAIKLGLSQSSVLSLITKNGIKRTRGTRAFQEALKKTNHTLNETRGNDWSDSEQEKIQRIITARELGRRKGV